MTKGEKRNARASAKRRPRPPALTFTANDGRTADDLFPACSAKLAAKYYSNKFTESATRKFKIECAQIEIFKRFLGLAASFYFSSTEVSTEERQQITIREKLNAIADAHRVFSELLCNLTTLERDRLWCPLWEAPDRPPRIVGLADRTTPRPFSDEQPFLCVLESFEKRVQARLVDLQNVKDPGGCPEKTDVRVFVTVARDFWVKVLGRKFAFQAVGRVPKSAAFEFCKHVLGPLDANVTDQKLATAIRRAVKSAHPIGRFRPS